MERCVGDEKNVTIFRGNGFVTIQLKKFVAQRKSGSIFMRGIRFYRRKIIISQCSSTSWIKQCSGWKPSSAKIYLLNQANLLLIELHQFNNPTSVKISIESLIKIIHQINWNAKRIRNNSPLPSLRITSTCHPIFICSNSKYLRLKSKDTSKKKCARLICFC